MTSCRQLAMDSGEPLAGTAPTGASRWLLVEHRASWGSHVVPDLLNKAMVEQLSTRGIGVLCVRTFDDRAAGEHGRMWLTDERRLTTHQWDFSTQPERDQQIAHIADTGQAHSSVMGSIVVSSEPLLLVCTNGKRDVCCAQVGRDILAGITSDQAVALESTHIGGHRFAGVTLLLPWGYVHRTATSDAAVQLISSARQGRLCLAGLRGRTGLAAPDQVAEIEVRHRHHIDGLDLDLRVEQSEPVLSDNLTDSPGGVSADSLIGTEVVISVQLGVVHDVLRVQRNSGQPRPESCGGDTKPLQWWQVTH